MTTSPATTHAWSGPLLDLNRPTPNRYVNVLAAGEAVPHAPDLHVLMKEDNLWRAVGTATQILRGDDDIVWGRGTIAVAGDAPWHEALLSGKKVAVSTGLSVLDDDVVEERWWHWPLRSLGVPTPSPLTLLTKWQVVYIHIDDAREPGDDSDLMFYISLMYPEIDVFRERHGIGKVDRPTE